MLRARGPIVHEPFHDVWMVTGYEEAVAIYHDQATWSSCTALPGPFPGFPVPLEGDNLTALIEEHRKELPFSDQLPCLDPPTHTAHRPLLMRLITPKRLKENEEFMWRLADETIDEFYAAGATVGEGEVVTADAPPFTLLLAAHRPGCPPSRPGSACPSRIAPASARTCSAGTDACNAVSGAPRARRWSTSRSST